MHQIEHPVWSVPVSPYLTTAWGFAENSFAREHQGILGKLPANTGGWAEAHRPNT
jgi:hypothetical protein